MPLGWTQFVLPALIDELVRHLIVEVLQVGKIGLTAQFPEIASIGRRTGVARILGLNFSGFVAWWLWRTIYLLKLPRFEKKLRVALDWTLDIFFSKDFVQYLHERAPVIADASDVPPSGQVASLYTQRLSHRS
jgi:hypothetical protein